MRTLVPLFLALLSMMTASTALGAQSAAASADLARAIAIWQAAKDKNAPAAQQALQTIAASTEDSATAFLLAEVKDAADRPHEVAVLGVLGGRARPGVLPTLLAVLARDGAAAHVRELAARAAVRQGHAGIDALLDRARPGNEATKDAERAAALAALGQAQEERAWRGMAPFVLTGTATERLRVLRLLDGARDLAPVTQARLRLLGEQNLELVTLAWRQLAQERHARAAEFVDDLLARAGTEPVPALRRELVLGLAALGDVDHAPAWLRLAAHESAPTRQALKEATPLLVAEPPFVQWLCKHGLTSDLPLEREVAIRVLRAAPIAELGELLADVRARLRRADPRALDLAIGLHELFAKDPSWRADLLVLARASDAALRVVGLQMLLRIECGDAVAVAQQSLDHRQWEVRSIAYRYLARFREVASIPLLIARYDREDGRLEAELNQTLFVHTGTRCWRRAEWEAWWNRHKQGFALPPLAAVANAKAGGGGGKTVSYFDIPLVSHKMAFLVDVSGSMQAKVGTGGNRTRLAEAKRQLVRVIEELPETHWFNVIVYETGVEAMWDKLRKATAKNRQEILGQVAALRIAGGTNIHDALELAFADPSIDTIYLLTDGQPSAGKIVDVDDLVDQVRRWNLSRQIVIHCVAIGIDSDLCKRLAGESGGTYVYVR